MTASPLKVADVHKSYNNRKVLEDISFSLVPGEVFGLIGLNGAGKTTLIKVLLDLITAEQGHAEIFDIKATSLHARKNLSYLPEKFQPSRYLRGLEYLDLSLAYYRKKTRRRAGAEYAQKTRSGSECAGFTSSDPIPRVWDKNWGSLGAFLTDASLLIL